MTSPQTHTRIVYGFEETNAAHLRAERRRTRRIIIVAAVSVLIGLLIGRAVDAAMTEHIRQIVEQDDTTHEIR